MYITKRKPTKWVDYIHLVEFTYNNIYRTSMKMNPFEVLYGNRCRTLINSASLEEKFNLTTTYVKRNGRNSEEG